MRVRVHLIVLIRASLLFLRLCKFLLKLLNVLLQGVIAAPRVCELALTGPEGGLRLMGTLLLQLAGSI